ncbi:uncharacterized protein LOC141915743 [Strix aluco]|uniref:uncharacterized protein LOC141915743 n=1 Tax=Strix aluco TaxID=111821 RepID=UPI003DA1FFC6
MAQSALPAAFSLAVAVSGGASGLARPPVHTHAGPGYPRLTAWPSVLLLLPGRVRAAGLAGGHPATLGCWGPKKGRASPLHSQRAGGGPGVALGARRGGTACTPLLVSIVVSIPACHAGDRGSIPRRGGGVAFCPRGAARADRGVGTLSKMMTILKVSVLAALAAPVNSRAALSELPETRGAAPAGDSSRQRLHPRRVPPWERVSCVQAGGVITAAG